MGIVGVEGAWRAIRSLLDQGCVSSLLDMERR